MLFTRRYEAVAHLVTAADGAPQYYSNASGHRLESIEQALAIDKLTQQAWLGHPKLRILRNEVDFNNKVIPMHTYLRLIFPNSSAIHCIQIIATTDFFCAVLGLPSAASRRYLACLIALFGGLLGVTMGCGLLEGLHALNSQYFPFRLSEFAGLWLGWLAVISAFVGLASGIVPAVLAARRSVIDGLRRVI